MADNDYDPAGSTQMFRAFVEETPAPQAPGSVSTYGSASSNNRSGLIIGVVVVAIAVVAAVIWLAVK
ncbi:MULTISPECIES: hypothetical protein [Kitasatospora]|uniref:Uncharacterized protein n=1 Tax=Kitasatospora cystarginea TaxID=58350 RepID=A0ABN3E0P2_9ACTN